MCFFQFLRNFRQYNACEQAELILRATLILPLPVGPKRENLSRGSTTLISYKRR